MKPRTANIANYSRTQSLRAADACAFRGERDGLALP